MAPTAEEIRVVVQEVLQSRETRRSEATEAAIDRFIASAESRAAAKRRKRRGIDQTANGDVLQEIVNLVRSKKDPVLSVALEEWDRQERLGISRVDRREKRSADLINQVFNLVGFFSVYQGVVLTAVTQLVSSSGSACGSLCGKVWVPCLLTVVGALVTIIAVGQKFAILTELEGEILEVKRDQREAVKRGVLVRREGLDFRFCKEGDLYYQKQKSFWGSKIGVIVSLILFAGIFILSYFVILCDFWVYTKWKNRPVGY